MRARRERATAHAALLRATDRDHLLDRWTYEEMLSTAIEFTKPLPRWWSAAARRERVKRRAAQRWPA